MGEELEEEWSKKNGKYRKRRDYTWVAIVIMVGMLVYLLYLFIDYARPECELLCMGIGTELEGWYDGCTLELIQYDRCGSPTTTTPLLSDVCVDPRPTMCITVYEPVCGDDGVTYSNSCVACSKPEVNSWSMGKCPSPMPYQMWHNATYTIGA